MTDEDLDEVSSIEKSIFSVPWSRKSLKDAIDMPDNIYIVSTDNGTIVGYCGMWAVLGEGNIVCVAVREEYRGRGVGRSLVRELVKRGIENGVDAFFLEVRESNAAAIHLYETEGFCNIGVRRNFYEKPVENAIVMSRMVSNKQIRN